MIHKRPGALAPATADPTDKTRKPEGLGLNIERARVLASEVSTKGITLEQLRGTADSLTSNNPLLSTFVANTADVLAKPGYDMRFFNRGIALAYYLIDNSLEQGAPMMGIESIRAASGQVEQIRQQRDLQTGLSSVLGSEADLSQAFDIALTGMPERTDVALARSGGGAVVLGAIVSMRYGGTGVEASFEEA